MKIADNQVIRENSKRGMFKVWHYLKFDIYLKKIGYLKFFRCFFSGDIANIVSNVAQAPKAYVNLLTGGAKAIPFTAKSVVGGLIHGLKSRKNLLKKITCGTRDALEGLITALQNMYTKAISNVLARKWNNYNLAKN